MEKLVGKVANLKTYTSNKAIGSNQSQGNQTTYKYVFDVEGNGFKIESCDVENINNGDFIAIAYRKRILGGDRQIEALYNFSNSTYFGPNPIVLILIALAGFSLIVTIFSVPFTADMVTTFLNMPILDTSFPFFALVPLVLFIGAGINLWFGMNALFLKNELRSMNNYG